MRLAALLMTVATLVPGSAAMAQTTPAKAPDPMAGPRVSVYAQRQTIVNRDIDGNVRRPEGSAEQAAAQQLDLTPSQRALVDAVFDRRALGLERFVEENLDFITRLNGAENASTREKWWLASRAYQGTAFMRMGGPLESQVRAVLPAEQIPVFDRMLREYWDAIGVEGTRGPQPKGRLGAVIDEKFKSLGREAEAAYHRCEKGGGLLYHFLFDSMKLSEEQGKQLRVVCAQYAVGGIDNKDKQTQGLLIVSVMQVLTPEQRVAIGKKFHPEAAAKRTPEPKKAMGSK